MRRKLLATLAATFAIAAVGFAPTASAETLLFKTSNGQLKEGQGITATSSNFVFYGTSGSASCPKVSYGGLVGSEAGPSAQILASEGSFECHLGTMPMKFTNVDFGVAEFEGGETEVYVEYDMAVPPVWGGCHLAGSLVGYWTPSESGTNGYYAAGLLTGEGPGGCPPEMYGEGSFYLTDANEGEVKLVTTP